MEQQTHELDESPSIPTSRRPCGVIFPRLLIGLVILTCAEVFSGASLQMGLWNPWTLLVTYWLYFAHFFFFTTLAIRSGRTSFWALYLWGVLFGLYESWITKVIWFGYDGDGKLALGRIGPYGFSELSMVFAFHPLMAFILPLAVACLLCPPLRRYFPDLAWLTGTSRAARAAQVYLVVSFAPVVAMNSGGAVNLAENVAFLTVLGTVLYLFARPGLAASDVRPIVAFGRGGFLGLCVYLGLLYSLTYRHLRPEGLPSVPVQLFTLAFYALPIAWLWMHRRREPLQAETVAVESRERRLALTLFWLVIAAALVLTPLRGHPKFFILFLPNFVVWSLAGFLLFAIALGTAVREYRERRDHNPASYAELQPRM
jgi:hypothetical protein